MSIISKETWDKFTQEEKDRIYKEYSDNIKIINKLGEHNALDIRAVNKEYEELFGKENLQPQPLTYEDVAKTIEENDVRNLSKKYYAIWQLLVVAKFLNKDWKPDWENIHEYKWYLRLDRGSKIDTDCCSIDNKCIVYFRTEELAKQAIQILGEDTVRLALTTEY